MHAYILHTKVDSISTCDSAATADMEARLAVLRWLMYYCCTHSLYAYIYIRAREIYMYVYSTLINNMHYRYSFKNTS